jgi:5'-phosphate synthase pdxT subunit
MTPVIGVLALQGDVAEHLRALAMTGARAVPVRRPDELDAVEGLVIPGGESTTIWKLITAFDLAEPLRKRIAGQMPVFGSCAGMILLADRLAGGIDGQETLGGIDIRVRRNAFGRQVDSFERDLELAGIAGRPQPPFRAVFIRAPWVEDAGGAVEVLGADPATGRIVAVRQGPLLATAFHPELTGDPRLHHLFAGIVRRRGALASGPLPGEVLVCTTGAAGMMGQTPRRKALAMGADTSAPTPPPSASTAKARSPR